MSSKIIDEVNEYKKLAQMIETTAKKADIDDENAGFIDEALLRLFYIKSIEFKFEKTQQQLSENTDMEIFDAVYEAQELIQNVSNLVFEQIENYASDSREFEIEIEKTSVDLESEDERDLLCQLYKCEGIIRMAERTANHYTIYGNASSGFEHLEGIDEDVGKPPEDKVYDDLGIDIYELFDIRDKLVVKIEKMVGKKDF